MKIVSHPTTYIQNALKSFFFCGYKTLPEKEVRNRLKELVESGAKKLELSKINAYRIPADSEAKHTIIFSDTASFLQRNPRNYTHLKKHADVVLWDPTDLTSKQYQSDLETVIQKIRGLNPEHTISIIARCATVDPTIGAVATINRNQNINLILDRGYGNVLKFARFRSFLSLLPCIQKILKRNFDCQGEGLIGQIPGKILFIHAKHDQLIRLGKKDLTDDLIRKRGTQNQDDQSIFLSNSDHWTSWDQGMHKTVYEFIGLQGVNVSSFPIKSKSLSFFARKILPTLVQGWC